MIYMLPEQLAVGGQGIDSGSKLILGSSSRLPQEANLPSANCVDFAVDISPVASNVHAILQARPDFTG